MIALKPHSLPCKILFAALVGFFCAYLMLNIFGKSSMLRDGPAHTSLIMLIDDTSQRPYVYRMLVPEIAQSLAAGAPEFLKSAVNSIALAIGSSHFVTRYGADSKWKEFSPKLAAPEYLFPIAIMMLVTYAALIAYAMVLYRISSIAYPGMQYVPMLSAMFGLFVLLPFITKFFKIYDAPTLLFSALALLLMVQQRWGAYLVIFVLGCLNKETMIFQTGVFFMAFANRMDWKRFWQLLLAQIGLWLLIKLGINAWYEDVPGKMVKFRYTWVLASVSKGFSAMNILVPMLIYGLVIAHWKQIPYVLKHALWLMPACAGVYYLLGFPYEYRVFFECLPALTVMAGYTLFRPLEKKVSPLPL